MKGWHKAASNHTLLPARLTIDWITEEQVALYLKIPPPGENNLVSLMSFTVDDSIPDKEDIEWEVRRM